MFCSVYTTKAQNQDEQAQQRLEDNRIKDSLDPWDDSNFKHISEDDFDGTDANTGFRPHKPEFFASRGPRDRKNDFY